MVVLKSAAEIEIMRQAGRIVAVVLADLRERVKPGVTLLELDQAAEKIIVQHGATPSFKGIPSGDPEAPPFPASICASVNEEIVHGIPSQRRLKEGDIISLDVGAYYKGYHGDSAITVPVGHVSQEAQDLMRVTQECLVAAIAAAKNGNRTGDIGAAIQRTAEPQGFSVVREYTSHGVGRELHEGFTLLNYGQAGHGMALRPGLTFAVEPMINAGKYGTKVKKDKWTVVTIDGKLSAHFEHTIATTEGDAEVLTKLD
ncbi:MAG: type I methionyl aminopeptidase [Chloroflexi bacterium]|nr:type I methionyl aminopeptidase [Chloroflexota bacterium]MCL5275626.1 type I methionyl aminopeptidase [Chloroflexota bacterium]